MQAVRVGSVQSVFWMALVVVVLVYLPCQSTSYSVSKSEGGTRLENMMKYLLGKDDFKNDYEEHYENDYEEEDDISTDDLTTDDVTTSTDEVIMSTDDLTSSTDNSISTDDITSSTDDITSSTDDITSSTDDNNISTDDTTTEKSTTTLLPTLSEQQVYEYTRDELSKTEDILDLFLSLVSENSTPEKSQDHPGVWWKFRMDQTQDEICIGSENKLCLELLEYLNEIEILISKLGNDVDSWRQEDLQELIKDNVILSNLYTKAQDDETFISSINEKNFKALIEELNEEVNISLDGVKQKIGVIVQAKTDSVVLVAVIGTLGGLMVVGLVGVMIYGGVKRKGSKAPTSKPYNKLQGEHIPIDGFLSDGPEHRQAPRMDPYAPRMPPPSSSGDPYGAPYGIRSESDYSREPVVTRVGQKLPRTHF